MDGNEIRERIEALNDIIVKELNPSFFTLNKKIEEARMEIEKLRTICDHMYDESQHCIYCGKEE